jgi:ABC-type lipoprotein release transport system permease subunit
MLVAAVSFVLLTSAAKSSSLHVRGTVKSAFRPAYDILVRPRGSKTGLELGEGLVRPNYLGGIFGGITDAQYRQVQGIRGVDVAAPIANIGYVLPIRAVVISLDDVVTRAPFQLYRVDTSYVADRGTSRYPAHTEFVYYTRRDRMHYDVSHGYRETFNGSQLDTNTPFVETRPSEDGPFALSRALSIFSARSPGEGTDNGLGTTCRPRGRVTACFEMYFPMLVAAIDPQEEARLLHLDRTIVSGRYLREGERPRVERTGRHIPVIASNRTYVGESFVSVIRQLRIPHNAAVPRLLASRRAYSFLSGLSGPRVKRYMLPVGETYQRFLNGNDRDPNLRGVLFSPLYWASSNVHYKRVARNVVRPTAFRNPISVWATPASSTGYWRAPGSNRDLQFRRLSEHAGSNYEVNGVYSTPTVKVVGKYDPTLLPSFSPLSRVPLETYYPPLLEPANARSSRALHGKSLLPTQNLGGYIQQPPLLLTTLEGAKAFYNPRFWSKVRGKENAPISVIRVRVKGVTGPDELSLERIKVVAQKIHDETGLDVDITAGSSPHPLLVDLPAGKFGRPELLLREGWSKKGVSVSFLRALDHKDLLLFALILVTCGFFLSNGALAAVRARREEIGTLRTLGWPGRAIFGVVLAELLGVGLMAGVLGTALALLIVAIFGLDLDLWRVVLVIPLAVGLALLAGLIPSLLASRGHPLDALRPPVSGSGRLGRVRSVMALALANLRRLPARTLLGAAGLVIGVAALTVLVAIERSFGGTLVGTLLGSAISVQVRGSDFVAVVLTIILAGVSVADVLYLNLRERSAELATLRAFGWSDGQVRATVVLEALGIGTIGSLTGGGIGVAVGAALLGVSVVPLLLAAAIAVGGGVVVAVSASLVPVSQVGRLTPHEVLATE